MAVELVTGLSLSEIKRYFERRTDVAFAFLFGSQAHGKAGPLSDVDVAVYFRPAERHPLEYEAEVYYPAEAEVWADLERMFGREVELLVLNRASASVAASAINAIPLAMNDLALYLDFDEVVSPAAADFREMLIRDFLEQEGLCKKN